MFHSKLIKLYEYIKNMFNRFKKSDTEDVRDPVITGMQPITSGNVLIHVPSEYTSFDISGAAEKLAQSGEFRCTHFKDEDKESWVFQKPITLLGEDYDIQIEVTSSDYDDLLIFQMPIYKDGSEGLTSNKLEAIATFDALILRFNSRIKSGSFAKDTDDNSNALVFMDSFSSSRMDFELFKRILNDFVKTLIGFRPEYDKAISRLELKFDHKAGSNDLAMRYLLKEVKRNEDLIGIGHEHNLPNDKNQ